jgi:hypothetical protein
MRGPISPASMSVRAPTGDRLLFGSQGVRPPRRPDRSRSTRCRRDRDPGLSGRPTRGPVTVIRDLTGAITLTVCITPAVTRRSRAAAAGEVRRAEPHTCRASAQPVRRSLSPLKEVAADRGGRCDGGGDCTTPEGGADVHGGRGRRLASGAIQPVDAERVGAVPQLAWLRSPECQIDVRRAPEIAGRCP